MLYFFSAALPRLDSASLLQTADPTKHRKASGLTVSQLNRWYEQGHPSNRIEAAGLLLHAHDLTERGAGAGLPFPAGRQFQEFWATSLVNVHMPALYKYDCGIVLNPKHVQLLCSFYVDFTSWDHGCKRSNLGAMLGPGGRDTPYPAAMFEDMLNASLALQKPDQDSYTYNEVLVNSTAYREHLPGSVAAVYYVHRADDPGDPECAMAAHSALVEIYGLKPEDLLLLRHMPRATPAFIEHSEAARRDDTDAEQAQQASSEAEEVSSAAQEVSSAEPGATACKALVPGLADDWCVAACTTTRDCPGGTCECDEPTDAASEDFPPSKQDSDGCTACGNGNNCCGQGGTWFGNCPAEHSWEDGNAACKKLLAEPSRKHVLQRRSRSRREWRDLWWAALTPGHNHT